MSFEPDGIFWFGYRLAVFVDQTSDQDLCWKNTPFAIPIIRRRG